MSSTVEPTAERSALDELLVEIDRDPIDLIEALRTEREGKVDNAALGRDLDRSELLFLQGRA